jgi:nucleoside-diphosphate-sugar epimerase
MNRVLITGISGFLGAHIAEKALTIGSIKIMGLKRSTSNLWRCDDYKNEITWVDSDNVNWKNEVTSFSPNIIIHSAWSGVYANDRLNWKSQIENLYFLLELLEIANATKTSKFIGLGSQAEYGTFSGKISETAIAKPNTAYGAVKLMACNLVESYCTENNLDWFWLRLFPLFGPKEDLQWLLPSVIRTIFDGTEMNLTPGLQRYAYLYVKDFSQLVLNMILNSKSSISGIYNISSTNTISLKQLVQKIGNVINPSVNLNFGALPYRHYQSMHMEGDMTKYQNAFGEMNISNFDDEVLNTINYYLSKFKTSGN